MQKNLQNNKESFSKTRRLGNVRSLIWCSDPADPRFDLLVYQMRKRNKKFKNSQQTIKWKNKTGLQSRWDLPAMGVLEETHPKQMPANINSDQKLNEYK